MFLRTLNTCRGEMPKMRGGLWYGGGGKGAGGVRGEFVMDGAPGPHSGKPLGRECRYHSSVQVEAEL